MPLWCKHLCCDCESARALILWCKCRTYTDMLITPLRASHGTPLLPFVQRHGFFVLSSASGWHRSILPWSTFCTTESEAEVSPKHCWELLDTGGHKAGMWFANFSRLSSTSFGDSSNAAATWRRSEKKRLMTNAASQHDSTDKPSGSCCWHNWYSSSGIIATKKGRPLEFNGGNLFTVNIVDINVVVCQSLNDEHRKRNFIIVLPVRP